MKARTKSYLFLMLLAMLASCTEPEQDELDQELSDNRSNSTERIAGEAVGDDGNLSFRISHDPGELAQYNELVASENHPVGHWDSCIGVLPTMFQLSDYTTFNPAPFTNPMPIGNGYFLSNMDSIRLVVEMGSHWVIDEWNVRVAETLPDLAAATQHTDSFAITNTQTYLDLRFGKPLSASTAIITFDLHVLRINMMGNVVATYTVTGGSNITPGGLRYTTLPLTTCSCGCAPSALIYPVE